MPDPTADDPDEAAREATRYQLRFQSLFDAGRAYAFPCDAAGQVRMDGLGEHERNSYLYARALVGRDFAVPRVYARRRPC